MRLRLEWLQLAAMCSCNVQVQPDCWLRYDVYFEGKGTLAAYRVPSGSGMVKALLISLFQTGYPAPPSPVMGYEGTWLTPIPMNLFSPMSPCTHFSPQDW